MTAVLTPDQLDRVHRHVDVLADQAVRRWAEEGEDLDIDVQYIVMRAIAKVLVEDAVGECEKRRA